MKNTLGLCLLASTLWLAPAANAQVNLIAPGATWRYLDTGVDQGTNWVKASFDDSTWKTGVGELGYGDSDEATVISFGPDTNLKYPTYYFRHTFNVANPAAFSQVAMTLTYDDGAVVYVNGVEVYRISMPTGPVLFTTLATTAADYTPETVVIPNSAFQAGANTIAVEVHQANATSSDVSFNLTLAGTVDADAPTLITSDPAAGAIVKELPFIGVLFSENVNGVNASDLLINNVPATGLTVISPREYQFTFPTPATGAVQVAFAPGHGITDQAPAPNAFAGASWSYVFDPNLTVAKAIISEFLADNNSGIEDEDGSRSDWIEIYNPGPGDLNLYNWSLSDVSTNLTKWRFPDMIIGANRYLLVFASEKNRTNALSRLHTNFKLSKSVGGYLALSDANGTPVSVFANYPAQVTDNSYGRDRIDFNTVGYFATPTPGAANTATGVGYAAEPIFNLESGVYTNNTLTLVITAPAGATVRYTTDGSEPTNTASGLAYTGPVTISANVAIKARVFQTGLWPSAIKARNFILLDASTRDFTSNLPLVVISTPGAIPASVVAGGARMRGTVAVFDTFRGRAALTGQPDYLGMGQFETFGQTSEGFPKKPHNIELNDEYGNDTKVSLLGMPAEADWKMRNPYSDKCLMNDFLAYELFEQMGNYQCRRRFVEVFIQSGTNQKLTTNNYYGVLVFLEKIEAGKDRVNIAEMTPSHTNEPAITGGYMFKRDKDSTGDLNFTTTNGTSFKMHEPKPKDLAGGVANPQVQWLRKYLSFYEAAVGAADWLTRTGTNHYSNYIDVDSFVDVHWVVEMPKQIDGYRISNYFSKDRNGKLRNVPIWDWNLSFGNANYLEGGKTNGWYYTQLGDGDHVFLRRLVGTSATTGDPEFKQKVVDRWSVLRTNVMNGERLLRRIDELAALLGEAAVRNYQKYPVLGTALWPNPNGTAGGWDMDYVTPTTYAGIIAQMKKWTMGRYLWIDAQFVRQPDFSYPGGPIPAGFTLSINATNPVYYTLDGTDPRAVGGGLAPGAQLYSGPITLNANARVFARARSATAAWQGTTWSGPTVGTYVVATPKVIISEIMYNPAPATGTTNNNDDFEYIEVKNVGTTAINLQRFRIRGGVDFDFPNVSLNAGQSGVIVANTAAFQARYGVGRTILGQYTDRLDNGGEHLTLEGSVREPILDFSYSDGWYPVTDGLGFSLVVANEAAPAAAWDTKAGWRPSGILNGSPSQNDPAQPTFPAVVINEALSHTDLPQVDTVELWNSGGVAADIGNWYLSDDRGNPKKYRFPAGTTIPGNGYFTVSEAQFNAGANGFSLSALGDEIYLFSGDASGNLTGYVQGYDFGAQRNGVTFGRYVTSTGDDQFVAQATSSLEGANSGPLVGPVVINEVHYHPVDVAANGAFWNNPEDEYIELHNVTGTPVPLFDPAATTNTWALRDAVDFQFPMNVTIPANGFVIVCSVDPANTTAIAAFRARNRIPAGTAVYGPWSGALDNSGDSVELIRPDNPQVAPSPNAGYVPYVLADKVRYANVAPWPAGADGIGASLQRVSPSAYGNDPANWRAIGPTPGSATTTGTLPVITEQPQSAVVLESRTAIFSVAATGTPPLQYQWQFNGQPIFGATNSILVLDNVQLTQSGNYGCFVLNPGGIVASANAALTVMVAAKILEQPKEVRVKVRPDPTAAPSTNATFSINATTLNPPINYQWRFNGSDIPGANASTLTVVNVTTNSFGQYSCAITDGAGTIYSTAATLYPLVNPVIVVAPLSQTVPVNGLVSLSAQITGFPPPFTYEWRQGSTPVLTATADSTIGVFTFNAAATNAALTYRVVVRNLANLAPGVASGFATITTVADSDGDGIPDSVELALGLNPNNPADASGDLDGDTMSNLAEQIAGTNPQDPNSYLKVVQTTSPGVVSISFGAVANRTYSVLYTDNLGSGSWQKLADVAGKAADRTETVTDSTSNPNRYYRIATPGR